MAIFPSFSRTRFASSRVLRKLLVVLWSNGFGVVLCDRVTLRAYLCDATQVRPGRIFVVHGAKKGMKAARSRILQAQLCFTDLLVLGSFGVSVPARLSYRGSCVPDTRTVQGVSALLQCPPRAGNECTCKRPQVPLLSIRM